MANGSDEAIKLQVQILWEKEMRKVLDGFSKAGKDVQRSFNTPVKDVENSAKRMNKAFRDSAGNARNIEVGLKNASKETRNISNGLAGLASSGMAVQKAFGFTKGQILGIFGIASIGGMISGTRAWRSELLGLNEEFAGMSDSLGSTGKAMGVYWSALGKTGATAGTVKASMKSLDEQGLKPAAEGFERLAVLGANLQQSTGVAADTWGQLNGKLSFNWKAPIQSIERINSVLISSGLSASQLTQVINGMNGSMENLNGFAKDGAKSAVALAAGYVGAAKAMTQMGISTQKATQFMDKLLDPEHIQDNLLLLSKAGISYSDFTQMLTSEGGKQNFFDKLGQGLPRLAQQLEQIQDPITRMQQAKALGLPIEIAQKLAAAGPGQMQKVMREAMEDAKNKDALNKKQQQAKEAAAKLDERLNLIRMQLFSKLLPIFEAALPKAMNLINQLFQRGGDLFGFIGERLNVVFQNLAPAFDAMLKGNWDEVPQKFGEGFKNITKDAISVLTKTIIPMVGQAFTEVLPMVIKSGWSVLKGIFEASPLLGIVAGIYAGTKIFGPALQLAWRVREWAQREEHHRETLAALTSKGLPGDGSTATAGGGMLDMLFGKNTAARKGLAGAGSKFQDLMHGKEEYDGVSFSRSGGLADSKTGKFFGKAGGKIGGGLKAVGKFAKGVPLLGLAMTGIDVAQAASSGQAEDVGGAVGSAAGMAIGAVLGGPVGAAVGSFIGDWIGKKVVSTWKQMQQDKAQGFFASEAQEKKINLSAKEYQQITGLNIVGGLDQQKVLSADMFRRLNEKAREGNISKTDKAVASVPGGYTAVSSKTEMEALTSMVALRKRAFQEDVKLAEEQLKLHKSGRKILTAEAEARFKEIVENEKQYKSINMLSQFTDLEIKKQAGIELTDMEKEKYEKLKKLQQRGSLELLTEGGKFQQLFRANFKNVTKDAIKNMDVLFDTLAGTISTGVGEIKKGLLMANAEISQIGFGVSIGGFSIGSDRHHMGQVIAKGSSEFMRKELDAMKNDSREIQITKLKALEARLRGEAGKAVFSTDKAFTDIMAKEGISTAEMNAALANNYKDADKARTIMADSIAAQLEVAKQQLKNEKRMAGSLASIADNTAPKVERASTDKWVDFLRSSGMIESGVVY